MSWSVMGQSDTKWSKRAGEVTDPCCNPRPHLAGRRTVLLVNTRGLPAVEVCHQSPNQIVSESGAVDQLNKEAVWHRVESLRDVQEALRWLKPGTTLAEIVSWAEVVVVVVINRAFNCFKGEMKWRVQRKCCLEGFQPRKVKGKIKIEKDRK